MRRERPRRWSGRAPRVASERRPSRRCIRLKVRDYLRGIRDDLLSIDQYRDSGITRKLLDLGSFLALCRNIDGLIGNAEFGQLRAYAMREGTPLCLIQLDYGSASFRL